jgi:LysR family glycine cleavage system transcriptional activator
MKKLPLAALRALATVHETGGVRPAARALHVTHSSVSRQLRELERWLGIELFEQRKGSKRMVLTAQGLALGKAALSGLTDLERAVEAVREWKRPNSVAIATTASLASRWLLPRLPRLASSHPWIEVSVIVQQAARDVAEQGADLSLRMGAGPWTGKCEPIMDDALYPVATRRYWSSLGERQPTRALARANLIHDRDPTTAWERWFAVHPVPGINLRMGSRFTSSDLTLRAAAQGLGVALARDRLAADDVAAGILFRPFRSEHIAIPQAYWLVYPATAEPRPAVLAVAEWLRTGSDRLVD